MDLERKDWENVIIACDKQMELMYTTLKNMKLAAKLQKVTFDKAVEEIKKFPDPKQKEKLPTGVQ